MTTLSLATSPFPGVGVVVVTILALLSGGCAGLDGSNQREFRKGNVVLYGTNNLLGVRYDRVAIGSDNSPCDNNPRFEFIVADQRMASDNLYVSALRKQASRVDACEWQSTPDHPAQEFLWDECRLTIRDGHMILLLVGLGNPRFTFVGTDGKHYRMPLSESDAIAVFGKPDSVRKWFTWGRHPF